MQPAPIHVNQFDAAGRFPNGTSSTRYDCMVAAGVMELDAGSGGRIRTTTTALRAAQNDQDKGIGLDDLAIAFPRFGASIDQGHKSWLSLAARFRAGDGAILAGSYAVVPAPETSQPGGRFPHAIRVQRYARPGVLIVNDPLAHGAREWRESVVQRFYLSGLALAGWTSGGSGSGAAADPGGVVVSVTNATAASSCSQVQIIAPANGVAAGVGIFPIPHELIGQPCVECAPGFVPAIVSVGPIQLLQGYTGPQDTGGAANACVRAGTKPGDRPAADPGQVAGGLLGSIVDVPALVTGFGLIARNIALLGFALVALLVGLYVLATANDRPGPRLPLPL